MATVNTFIVCTRGIDAAGQYTAEPGDTTFLRVPPSRSAYTPADKLSRERWKKAVIAAADGTEDDVTGSTGDVLFFVHGYNNDIASVLWRTRMLQTTLAAQGWRGLVVGFDWPSDNSTLNYLEDRHDASQVAQRLIDDVLQLLIDAQFPAGADTPQCTINVHLLGHSTGAYVIMEAFASAAKNGEFFKKPWRIAQVAFIGGDVSSASLATTSDWATPMFDRIFRLTNYANGYDKVLGVSNMKRLGTSPRAGRVGLPANAPAKTVDVNCADYFAGKDPAQSQFTGTFCHSWHIGDANFALDLALTLEGEIDRLVIPTRDNVGGRLKLVGGRKRPAGQPGWDATHPPGA